jgi:hypothetical protein
MTWQDDQHGGGECCKWAFYNVIIRYCYHIRLGVEYPVLFSLVAKAESSNLAVDKISGTANEIRVPHQNRQL